MFPNISHDFQGFFVIRYGHELTPGDMRRAIAVMSIFSVSSLPGFASRLIIATLSLKAEASNQTSVEQLWQKPVSLYSQQQS